MLLRLPDIYDHVGVALTCIRRPSTAVRGPLNDGHLDSVKLLNTLVIFLSYFGTRRVEHI